MPVVGTARKFIQKAHFKVEVDGQDAGGFMKAGPFKRTYAIVDQGEGGASTSVDKTPSTYTVPNIKLEGALEIGKTVLADWDAAQKAGDRTKRNISVISVDADGTELKRWNATGCSIADYTAADFDRGAEAENVMEAAEISMVDWDEVRV